MAKEIRLKHGQVALVDDDDYDWLNQWSWYLSSNGYARRTLPRPRRTATTIAMHRQILNAAPGTIVDHIDGNRLNNQRKNLRIVLPWQNRTNSRPRAKSSRFKGVHWDSKGKEWRASISVNRKMFQIGRFVREADAARAYDAAARVHFGEFARLNFPDEQN